ncbi:hypothetical protein FEE95_01130 [Maribacter algarum]|uniref:Membrane metalloprotease n=1 Tax=Maribacter algarum (ex Zhang et al. 2020) TaxID=2578118 RepID=A0A5S3PST7_9FLAO|nr:hypothetical protein [Maribacter algarum]TMM58059.1 hypothetical protein FEE95_01130 [Maribacter algarum]
MKHLRIWILFLFLGLTITCSKKSDDTSPDSTEDPVVEVDRSANLLAAGASANDILSNDKFTKLKVEIAFVTGFRPTQESMDEFVAFLKTYTFKENIEMVFNELPSPEKETLTIQEIADLETENRTVYNDGETLGIYIYFADAPADDNKEDEGILTLGAVYRNTTIVIHEETIRRLAARSILITDADVETATLNHEFGHLFGLVNFGTDQVNDHEDVDAEAHCNVPGCLMRAQLQFGQSNGKSSNLVAKTEIKPSCSLSSISVLKILESNTKKGSVNAVPLDAECILDLRSNGGR